jgi:hypothetical protein
MRDTITIGTIAGSISTITITLFTWILRLLGFNFISIWETAANIILNKGLIHEPVGYFIGMVAHFTLGAIFGIMLAYMLRLTGKDFYILKGIGLGALFWLGSIGFFMHLLNIQIQGRNSPISNIIVVIEFHIMGIVTSSIIKKYGKFKIK